MSNPNTSLFVLSALGIFMLTDNVLASVSAIGGQIVNDRNEVITLRVAAEPLAVDEADAVAAGAIRKVTFDSPSHVLLKSAGTGGTPYQVEVTARDMVFVVRHHQAAFTVTRTGNGFSISAPENASGCTVSDQINVYWQANQMVAHKAIGVAQFSTKMRDDPNQPCMLAKRSEADALVLDSMQSPAIAIDYDAAIQRRTRDGSNAVRVILSSVDLSSGTVGTAFTRIMQACERQKVWCLLDPGLTALGKPRGSGGVQYFASEDVRTALQMHEDHVMLVLRESGTAAFDPGAAINQLRAAGLPHVLIFSEDSLRAVSGETVDAAGLLAADGYQAIALAMDSRQALMDATSGVPVVAMSGAAAAKPQTAPAQNPCGLSVNRGSTEMLGAPCEARISRRGGRIIMPVSGTHDPGPKLTPTSPWLTVDSFDDPMLTIRVQPWLLPGTSQARVGAVVVRVTDQQTRSTVWGYIHIIQLSK